MIDIESAVFSGVAEKFIAAYPAGSRYGEPQDTPASFPCLTLWETDNTTYQGSLDAERKEYHSVLTYEVNVYSNKVSGAKQECKAIMDIVDQEMFAMGFNRTVCTPTKNQDTRIYRMTARYEGIADENYIIYRR